MDYLSSYTASLLEQSRFYYPPLAAMRSAMHDPRAPVDGAQGGGGPAGALGPLMELGLLRGEHAPLDLSMKTIRQTPDSTADDDVVILEHRRHNARQQALQLAAAMAAGKLPFAFAGRLGDAFLGPAGPPSLYDHHHLPPLLQTGNGGPTVVVTSGGLVTTLPSAAMYRAGSQESGAGQNGGGAGSGGSSAFLPPTPSSMHSGLCGGLNGFCLDPHRCRLASLSTAVATSSASSRPLPAAAFHASSPFAAMYERHLAKLQQQAASQAAGAPSSATGVLQSLSELHMSSPGGATSYPPPHPPSTAATSTTDVLKHAAFTSVLAADRGYPLGPPPFPMSSLYAPHHQQQQQQPTQQHHHSSHHSSAGAGKGGVPVSCACCIPKPYPLSCACCLPYPAPGAGAGAPPGSSVRGHYESHNSLFGCCPPAPNTTTAAGTITNGGSHLTPTSLPVTPTASELVKSGSKSSGSSKRDSSSKNEEGSTKHHHHHREHQNNNNNHHHHHSSSHKSSRHSTSPPKSNKISAPTPVRSTTPTTAPPPLPQQLPSRVTSPIAKSEERRTPLANHSHHHGQHHHSSNSRSSSPGKHHQQVLENGGSSGRWIAHPHATAALLATSKDGVKLSTPPSSSPSGTPPILQGGGHTKAVRVFAPVVHIPPSPPTSNPAPSVVSRGSVSSPPPPPTSGPRFPPLLLAPSAAASAFSLHHPASASLEPYAPSAALFAAQAHLLSAVAAKAQAAKQQLMQEGANWDQQVQLEAPAAKMARMSPNTAELTSGTSQHRRHHHHHHHHKTAPASSSLTSGSGSPPSPQPQQQLLKKESGEVAPPVPVIGRWMLTPPTVTSLAPPQTSSSSSLITPPAPETVSGNWLTTDSASAAVAPAASHPKKSSLPPELPASPAEGCSPNGAAMAMEHKTELLVVGGGGGLATMPSPALSTAPPGVTAVVAASVSPVVSEPLTAASVAPSIKLCKDEQQWKTPSPSKRPSTDDLSGQCLPQQPAKKKKKKDVIVISMRDEHQVHEGNQIMKSVKRKLTDEHSRRPAGAAPSPPHLAKDLHFPTTTSSPLAVASPTPARAHRNHHHHHHQPSPNQTSTATSTQLFNGSTMETTETKPTIDALQAVSAAASSSHFNADTTVAPPTAVTSIASSDETMTVPRVLPPVGVTLVKTHHAGGSHQYKSSVLTSSSRCQQQLQSTLAPPLTTVLTSPEVASPPVVEDATTAMLRQYYEQQKQRLQDYDQRKRSESPHSGAAVAPPPTKPRVSPSTTPPLPALPTVGLVSAVSRQMALATALTPRPEEDEAQDGDDEREDDEEERKKGAKVVAADGTSVAKDEKLDDASGITAAAHVLGTNGVIKMTSVPVSLLPIAAATPPSTSGTITTTLPEPTASIKLETDASPETSSSATPTSAPTRVENTKRLMINKALGETMLHRAARLGYLDVVNYCLESQTGSIDVRDNAGYTPLHECCSRGHLEIARQLLQHGADPNVSAAGGVQPIHDAIENDQLEIVRLLLSYGADPLIATYSGMTPEKLALSLPMKEFVKGYLADISGDYDKDILPWQFHGSARFFDPWPAGYDPLDDVPSDGEEECVAGGDPDAAGGDEEDVDDAAALVFEVSDKPHIPTYRVPTTTCRRNGSGTLSFCLLSDVLHQTCMDREAFLACYPDIRVDTMSGQQFATQARCTQLMVDTPASPTPPSGGGSVVSSTASVTTGTTAATAPWVELVRWDDTLRDILDIEQVTIPLVGI